MRGSRRWLDSGRYELERHRLPVDRGRHRATQDRIVEGCDVGREPVGVDRRAGLLVQAAAASPIERDTEAFAGLVALLGWDRRDLQPPGEKVGPPLLPVDVRGIDLQHDPVDARGPRV